eukprot:2859118-Prymnesium_polylepis.1
MAPEQANDAELQQVCCTSLGPRSARSAGVSDRHRRARAPKARLHVRLVLAVWRVHLAALLIARLMLPAAAADLLRHQRGRVRAHRHQRARAPKAHLVRVVPAVGEFISQCRSTLAHNQLTLR